MSTYWRLQCTTHNESAPDDGWNHGQDELALIWRTRDRITEMVRAAGDVYDIDALELRKPWREIKYDLRTFLTAHNDCLVVLLNEYGDREDVESRAKLPPNHCRTCTCEPR